MEFDERYNPFFALKKFNHTCSSMLSLFKCKKRVISFVSVLMFNVGSRVLFVLFLQVHDLYALGISFGTGGKLYPQGQDGEYLAVKKNQSFFIEEDISLMDLNSNGILFEDYSDYRILIFYQGVKDENGVSRNDIVTSFAQLTYANGVEVFPVLKNGWSYIMWIYKYDKPISDPTKTRIGITRLPFRTVMDRSTQNTIISSDGKTVLTIPAEAIPTATDVSVPSPTDVSPQSVSAASSKLKDILGTFFQPIVIREFYAVDSNGTKFTGNFEKSVTIEIPYNDTNNDGFVDGTNPKIKEEEISVFYLDSTRSSWIRVPNRTVDTVNNKVTFEANHLSSYALFGSSEIDLNGIYAYPTPFEASSGHQNITFANLPNEGILRIWTSSGRLVRKIQFSLTDTSRKLSWDVKNENGEECGSDVYIYGVESGPNLKEGKVVVLR